MVRDLYRCGGCPIFLLRFSRVIICFVSEVLLGLPSPCRDVAVRAVWDCSALILACLPKGSLPCDIS